MRWFKLSLLFLAFVLSLPLHAGAQDKLALNQTYRDAIRLNYNTGLTQIPLPPGEWVLTGLDESISSLMTPLLSVHLARIQNNTLMGIIRFRLNKGMSSGIWLGSNFCDRTRIHFIEKKANYRDGDVDCWGINHAGYSSRKRPAKRQTIDYLAGRKITIPKTLVSVEFRRADQSKFVWSGYLFNPELEGIEPSHTSSWKNSPWHMSEAQRDPRKVTYIERLKVWGKNWKPKIDAGFEGKLKALK